MLAFLKNLLLAALEYFKYSNNKQLLEAGAAKQELEARNEADKDIAIAEDIRASNDIDDSFLLSPEDRNKK